MADIDYAGVLLNHSGISWAPVTMTSTAFSSLSIPISCLSWDAPSRP
jgi:hypothetical protein